MSASSRSAPSSIARMTSLRRPERIAVTSPLGWKVLGGIRLSPVSACGFQGDNRTLTRFAALFEAGAVENDLGLGRVHCQVLDGQLVRLELAERFQCRIGDLDAGDDRPFVVAVGEVALGLVGSEIFEEFDRGCL